MIDPAYVVCALEIRDEKLAEARAEIKRLRAAADEALNVLIGCCVPAGGCDDREAILRVQSMLRAALK